ncbi:MAG: polyphosphate polymerase domain-containing protein [Bacteroidales bacterium]|nr:polyphosphate polymerase domain-containing protein [Bacteroidales bacterium]
MGYTIEELLSGFAPITLEEMSSVKLMNRTDTKFVTNTEKLMRLLEMAGDDYYVQEIGGKHIMEYDTTYFDTDRVDMYNQHQWGHTNRQKLRFRTYVSSNLQFMEVKTKNNHGRTKKKRMEVLDMDLHDPEKLAFLTRHLRYDAGTLMPTINNNFCRITLVNRAKTERLTIDSRLQFNNLISGQTRDMGPLVIIELKRDGLVFSPVLEMLRQLHIHPHGFSKYCMGSAMTNPELPVNRFKRKLIEIDKIVGQPRH